MKKIFTVQLTAEEMVGIQNLLERVLTTTDIISARMAIQELLNKFRDAQPSLED